MFSKLFLGHLSRPRNAGKLEGAAIGTARFKGLGCMDTLAIYIVPDKARISKIKFGARGCSATIAAASYLTELASGKTLAEAEKIAPGRIFKDLGLEVRKRHSAELAVEALRNAIAKARRSG